MYWQSEEKNARAKREQNFEVAADQIAYNLEDRMATYEVVLRGVKGYFEGSERIDRAEFQAYVSALQLQATRPGLQGVSLILRVKFRLFIDTLAEQFRFFLAPVFKGIDWGDMPKCALRDVVVVSLPVVVQG